VYYIPPISYSEEIFAQTISQKAPAAETPKNPLRTKMLPGVSVLFPTRIRRISSLFHKLRINLFGNDVSQFSQ
jgi:hypothetical protein